MAITIRLAQDIEQRLNRLAAQTGRAKAYFLRRFIVGGWMLLKIIVWLKPPWSASVKVRKLCLTQPNKGEVLASVNNSHQQLTRR